MKRTRLKHQSSKKRKEIADTSKARREYVEQAGVCQGCGSWAVQDCHEIARGAHRSKAVYERFTWLALCSGCHDRMDGYSIWPLEAQLALKLLVDPEYFDLVAFNRLRGRADNAITMADLVPYLRLR